MNLPEGFAWGPALFVLGFAVFALVKIVRFGSWRGLIFNGRVQRTVAELNVDRKSRLLKTRLKVHVVEQDKGKAVGLEFASTAPLAFSVTGYSLSPQEARALITALQQATAGMPA